MWYLHFGTPTFWIIVGVLAGLVIPFSTWQYFCISTEMQSKVIRQKDKEIGELQKNVMVLDKKTKSTFFRLQSQRSEKLEDGKVKIIAILEPVGTLIVPTLAVEVSVIDYSAKIVSFNFLSSGSTGVRAVKSNLQDYLAWEKENNIAPEPVQVTVILSNSPKTNKSLQLRFTPSEQSVKSADNK